MRARLAGERGETLLELIVALAILGIAVVAVVGGLSAALMLTDVHRKQAAAGVAVRDYAEATQTAVATGHYTACAAPPVTFTPPTGYTTSVVAIRFWSGTAWQPTCTTDIGLQRLTLQVASVDGRAAERLDVVLRKPCGLTDPLCS
jgi:type II secretory pathway pseudopilin PulG